METKKEILQIGEDGADIEMHILKTEVGIYFVHFEEYILNDKQERVRKENGAMVYPFNSAEEIHNYFGKQLIGKKVSL